MTTLSTTAWAAHDVGLATAIGGTLFGRSALEPALHQAVDQTDHQRVSSIAWKRFSWINLAAHAVFGVTWLVGRSMISGREVSGSARSLVRLKDGLVVASLATGVASIVTGRTLAKRSERAGTNIRENEKRGLRRLTGGLGMANLLCNIAIMAVTTVLAMEGSQSARFALRSRRLP